MLATYTPRPVLEIGTAVGYSAYMISREIASYGGVVYTFEIGYWDYLSACHSLYQAHAYNVISYHADFLAVDLTKL